MATYYKPQSPIQSGEDFIYPITTADQIMKSDKSRRLEQAGLIVADNSTSLGGVAAKDYARKTDTAPDSSKLGGKAPEYYTWTNNLLKNSNFASKYLINLNGKTEYTDIGDVFSGWIKESTSVLTLNDDYITIDNSANNNTEQIIYTDRKEEAEKLIGKTVTLAVCTSEGDIHCASGIVSTDTPCAVVFTEKFDCALQFFSNTGSYQLTRLIIKAGKTASIKWIVLYEGAYTAETLPQPQWLHPRLEMIRMGLPTQPRNLLDNSDFTNLVNQRGITSKTSVSAYSYFIDRWVNQTSEARSFTLSTSGIGLSLATTLLQKIEKIEAGKIVTFAIKLSDGTIATLTGTVQYTSDGSWTRFASITHSFGDMYMETMNGFVNVVVYNTKVITIEWAALYEGSYTAETLPPYVPKGYAVELAECQRYFYKMKSYWKWVSAGICETSTKAFIPIVLPREMRIVPTVSITNPSLIKVKCGSIGLQIPSDIIWTYAVLDSRIVQMAVTVTGAKNGDVAFLYFDDGGEITFSADI